MRALPLVLVCCACTSVKQEVQPTPSRQVWVVDAVENLGLFSDEATKAREALANWLTSQGKPAVDSSSRVARGLAFAREGKHAVTGVSCGLPLDSYEAARRWRVELGIDRLVTADAQCPINTACELNVQTTNLEDERLDSQFWETSLDENGPALTAFMKAVPTLHAPGPQGGGGLGTGTGSGSGIRNEDAFTARVSRADIRSRAFSKFLVAPFPSLAAADVVACMGADLDNANVLFEIAGNGDLVRCEAERACLCELLEKTERSAELHGARWSAQLEVHRRTRFNAEGRLLLSVNTIDETVSDPSIRGWSPPSRRLLAGCFENRTQPVRSASQWELVFDDLGKVTKLEAKGAPLDVETAACVARLLRTSVAPCPARSGLSATVEVQATLIELKKN